MQHVVKKGYPFRYTLKHKIGLTLLLIALFIFGYFTLGLFLWDLSVEEIRQLQLKMLGAGFVSFGLIFKTCFDKALRAKLKQFF